MSALEWSDKNMKTNGHWRIPLSRHVLYFESSPCYFLKETRGDWWLSSCFSPISHPLLAIIVSDYCNKMLRNTQLRYSQIYGYQILNSFTVKRIFKEPHFIKIKNLPSVIFLGKLSPVWKSLSSFKEEISVRFLTWSLKWRRF